MRFYAGLLWFASLSVQAFGFDGHQIVANIADAHLTPKSIARIQAITNEPLAELATWPDKVKKQSQWQHTAAWHYLSIDDDENWQGYLHSSKGDVLTALTAQTQVLQDKLSSQQDKRNALAFVVHLIGDLHQPLHIGRRGDLGGNKVKVNWFGQASNLHKVWDTGLIQQKGLSVAAYSQLLISESADHEMQSWAEAITPLDWAKESKTMRVGVYDFVKPDWFWQRPKLADDYFETHQLTIELRLQQAGVRLAGWLNHHL